MVTAMPIVRLERDFEKLEIGGPAETIKPTPLRST